jgi:chromosome segregation ATPase
VDLHHRFNQMLRQTSAEKTSANETLLSTERAALESSIKMKDDQLASLSSQLSEYANQLSELETKLGVVSEELKSRKVLETKLSMVSEELKSRKVLLQNIEAQHEKEMTRLHMKFQTALGNSRIEAVQIFRKSSEFQGLLNNYEVEWLLGTIEACKKMCKEKYPGQDFDFLEDDAVLEKVSSNDEAVIKETSTIIATEEVLDALQIPNDRLEDLENVLDDFP